MNPLIVLGPSTRAAAFSALRAGFQPWCVDLFADLDLAAVAPVKQITIDDYPSGLVQLIRDHAPPAPIIYTGGLENYPRVYARLAQLRTVWGYLHPEPFTATDSVRNPLALGACCAGHGLDFPRTAASVGGVPTDGAWLCKPRNGAGGRGITRWNGQQLVHPEKFFFQQHLCGPSFSAAFVYTGSETFFLALTRQLVGESFLHAPSPFSYCGSIGPVASPSAASLFEQCRKIGDSLVQFDSNLRGLFGVDLIWNDGRAYVIEVNPRYTASVEILEFVNPEVHALTLHAQAYGADVPISLNAPQINKALCLGKGIYFAAKRMVIPAAGPWSMIDTPNPGNVPTYADIPALGSVIESGQPVMTIFGSGSDDESVLAQLKQKAGELDRHFR